MDNNKGPVDLPESGAAHLMTQCLANIQRSAEGTAAYMENLRYDYLEGKSDVSLTKGLGARYINESGASRTRTETNAPASTSHGGAGG